MKIKKLIRLKLFLLLLLITFNKEVKAQQDIQFSQYIFNGLIVNPAYAGYKEDVFLNSTYRKQWVNYPGAPETGTLSIDGVANPLGSKTVGLGTQITWDRLGPQESLSFYASYAYRLQLNSADDSRLSLGLAVGINQYSLDGDKLFVRDSNDPGIPVGKTSSVKPNANLGIYYYNPKFYIGLSALNLFSNNIYGNFLVGSSSYDYVITRKSKHYYFTGGGIINLSEGLKLKPSFMVKEDFKGPTNLDLNTFLLFNDRFWLGASYQTGINIFKKSALQSDLEKNDAISVMADISISERLRLGYAYDFTTSKLADYQNGSHEIYLGVLLFNKKKERIYSPRYF